MYNPDCTVIAELRGQSMADVLVLDDPDQSTCDMTRYILESLLPFKCRYCTREFDDCTRFVNHKRAHELKYGKFWRGKVMTKSTPRGKKTRLLLNGKTGILASTYTSAEDNLKYMCYGDTDGGIVVYQYRDKKFIKLFTYKVFDEIPITGRNLPCQYMFPMYKNKGGSIMARGSIKHRRKGVARKFTRKNGGKYICRVCSKTFSNSYAWELHERSHSIRTAGSKVTIKVNANKKLLCKICSKVFHQADILELHERSHAFKTPEKKSPKSGSPCVSKERFILDAFLENGSHECKHCPQSFSDLAEWELHERSHTFMNSKQNILTLKIREAVQAFAETETAKVKAKQEIKAESVQSNNQVFKRLPINVRSLIKCKVPLVSNRYIPQAKIAPRKCPEEHIRLQKVTKQLQEQLQKNSTSDQQLTAIKLKKTLIPNRGPAATVLPQGGQLLPCRFCSMKFETVNELALHSKSHTNKPGSGKGRPFQCGLCGKFFTQSGSLRAHERIHTGERPYACDICDKSFHESGKLKRHQRTHTGEKPYECRYCFRRFAQNGTRKSHEKTHRDAPAPPTITLADISPHAFFLPKSV